MATLRQFPVVGVRFPSPPERDQIGERGAIRQDFAARSWRVKQRGPEGVFGPMGRALRIARDLVLALWVIAALAFFLFVIAGCVL
jgi:hypothetical protein